MISVGKQLEINYVVAKSAEFEAKREFDKIRAKLEIVEVNYNLSKIPFSNVIKIKCYKYKTYIKYLDGKYRYLSKDIDHESTLRYICVHTSKWIEFGKDGNNSKWNSYLTSGMSEKVRYAVNNYGLNQPLYLKNKKIYDDHIYLQISYNDLKTRDDIAKDNYNISRINTGKALGDWTKWKQSNMTADELSDLNPDVFGGSFIDVFSWKTIGIGFGVLIFMIGIYIYIKRR